MSSQPLSQQCLCCPIADKPCSHRVDARTQILCSQLIPVGARFARDEAATSAAKLQPFQLRHQIIQPIHLLLSDLAGRQPIDVVSQLPHRAAFEHRPQRYVALQGLCTREAICVASKECPPSSKKLSRTPTRSTLNTWAQMSARVCSSSLPGLGSPGFATGRSPGPARPCGRACRWH